MGFSTVTLLYFLIKCASSQLYTVNTVVGSNLPLHNFFPQQPGYVQTYNSLPLRGRVLDGRSVELPVGTTIQESVPVRRIVRVKSEVNAQNNQARRVLNSAKPPVFRQLASNPARSIARQEPLIQTPPLTLEQTSSTTTPIPQISLEGNPEEIVDKIITETSLQGGKILKSVKTLIKNPLIAKLLDSNSKNDDPCAIVPTNLDVITQNLIDGVTTSREELVALIRVVQNMKAAGNETVKVLRHASEAVKLMDPLIPKFSSVFKANDACDSSIKSTIGSLNKVGSVLTTLGKTDIVAKDDYTKTRFIQGGEASRIIGKVAGMFYNFTTF